MSRTFSTNIASVLSLKLFTKCGFKPKACQIRRTESWEMPASLAMSQLLQWVLAAGVVSKVFVTTSSTFSSEISRGAPLRGASTMPSKDCSIKRRLHFPTMCWQTPNSLATSRLLLPWAHSNITLARSAKLCWLLGLRSINLRFSSCSLLSLIGLTGRPFGILLLLQLAYPNHNTNVTDLSFSTLVAESGKSSVHRYVGTRNERGSIRRQKKSDFRNIAWFADPAQRMELQYLLFARHALRKPLLQ